MRAIRQTSICSILSLVLLVFSQQCFAESGIGQMDVSERHESGMCSPSTGGLIAFGTAFSIPTFILSTARHEASHALAATLVGGKVIGFHVIPGYHDGNFYFGLTEYDPSWNPSVAEDTQVSLAPIYSSLLFQGTYIALAATNNLPKDKTLQLMLAETAVAAWVDYANYAMGHHEGTDLVHVFEINGLHSEGQRWPYRLLMGAVGVGTGIGIGIGVAKLFKSDSAASAPGAPMMPAPTNVMQLNGSF